MLIVEDIIDTGLTLRYLMENLARRKPASLRVCALLDKDKGRDEVVVEPTTSASASPTASSSATGWTTRRSIATYPTSACSSRRCTARASERRGHEWDAVRYRRRRAYIREEPCRPGRGTAVVRRG